MLLEHTFTCAAAICMLWWRDHGGAVLSSLPLLPLTHIVNEPKQKSRRTVVQASISARAVVQAAAMPMVTDHGAWCIRVGVRISYAQFCFANMCSILLLTCDNLYM